MRPTWLIEAGVYREEADLLLAEIRRQGMTGALVPHRALKAGERPVVDGQPLPPDACVVGYGTFPFARQIQLHHPWTPGAWCDPVALDCTTYFGHFETYLLNERHEVLPGVEAVRQADRLFAAFGGGGEVFVRPAGCHKLFVGRRVARESFAGALSPARFDPATLVVVAGVKPIGREWRLVVIGDDVIAASRYAAGGTRSVAPGCPAEVRGFVTGMLADIAWRPDPIFMLDVCESGGSLRLVELNGFSCSWLYQCDLAEVVRKASDIALRQWSGRPAPRLTGGGSADQ